MRILRGYKAQVIFPVNGMIRDHVLTPSNERFWMLPEIGLSGFIDIAFDTADGDGTDALVNVDAGINVATGPGAGLPGPCCGAVV